MGVDRDYSSEFIHELESYIKNYCYDESSWTSRLVSFINRLLLCRNLENDFDNYKKCLGENKEDALKKAGKILKKIKNVEADYEKKFNNCETNIEGYNEIALDIVSQIQSEGSVIADIAPLRNKYTDYKTDEVSSDKDYIEKLLERSPDCWFTDEYDAVAKHYLKEGYVEINGELYEITYNDEGKKCVLIDNKKIEISENNTIEIEDVENKVSKEIKLGKEVDLKEQILNMFYNKVDCSDPGNHDSLSEVNNSFSLTGKHVYVLDDTSSEKFLKSLDKAITNSNNFDSQRARDRAYGNYDVAKYLFELDKDNNGIKDHKYLFSPNERPVIFISDDEEHVNISSIKMGVIPEEKVSTISGNIVILPDASSNLDSYEVVTGQGSEYEAYMEGILDNNIDTYDEKDFIKCLIKEGIGVAASAVDLVVPGASTVVSAVFKVEDFVENMEKPTTAEAKLMTFSRECAQHLGFRVSYSSDEIKLIQSDTTEMRLSKLFTEYKYEDYKCMEDFFSHNIEGKDINSFKILESDSDNVVMSKMKNINTLLIDLESLAKSCRGMPDDSANKVFLLDFLGSFDYNFDTEDKKGENDE